MAEFSLLLFTLLIYVQVLYACNADIECNVSSGIPKLLDDVLYKK